MVKEGRVVEGLVTWWSETLVTRVWRKKAGWWRAWWPGGLKLW